jgi:nitroimidazol reductase NimA-like FMN-containing flavoprotein (pyridoxamine 5'-phosphate oxidase superfamily)
LFPGLLGYWSTVKAPPRPTDELAMLRRLFRDVPVAHVATLEADGTPHVVPLWFVWLEDALFLTSRRGTRVEANLGRGGVVSASIDRGVNWMEHQGVLVRGSAEVLPPGHSSVKRALSAWFDKYSERLSGPGFAAYARDVEHPVVARLEPRRFSTWSNTRQP